MVGQERWEQIRQMFFDEKMAIAEIARRLGMDRKTVRRWVDRRDRGLPVAGPARRDRWIDPFAAKVEEWVDRSKGHVRVRFPRFSGGF